MGTGAKISPLDDPVPLWAGDGYVTDHINNAYHHAHSMEYNVDTRQHNSGWR
jgi:hypothetical protein